MKKIAFALMCALTVFLLSGCSKSGDKEPEIVGGEDVTNPFLNPGGKIIDKGVNIVGAWAHCETLLDEKQRDFYFYLIDSKGYITGYVCYESPNYPMLDKNGVFHFPQKKVTLGEEGGWPWKGGKTMMEVLIGIITHFQNDSYHVEVKDLNVYKDEKSGKFGYSCSISYESGLWESRKGDYVLKNINVDTYSLSYSTYEQYYVEEGLKDESYKGIVYLRRVKAFQE